MSTESRSSVIEQKSFAEALSWHEEVRQLREVNREQHRMIRQWESVAETRAELIRNLRATLGLDPDISDEEELM